MSVQGSKPNLLFIFLVSAFLVAMKPIVLRMETPNGEKLTSNEESLAKESQRCHLIHNLEEHSAYIHRTVVPRVEVEIEQLLQKQTAASGETFYIAESVDYGDLFHAHIRDPLRVIARSSDQGLDGQFTNPEIYHLQYHSYEYMDYMILGWLKQLEKIDNAPLQSWLLKRKNYMEKLKSHQNFGSAGRSVVFDHNLKPLGEISLDLFAILWDQSLGEKSPGQQWLRQKLRYLDPLDNAIDTTLLKHRSVVSDLEQFRIIRPLNIKGYDQPATVYFAKLEDSPRVQSVIQKAQALGLDSIVNVQSRYYHPSAFPHLKNPNLHRELMAELVHAAEATTKENPLYLYGHVLENSFDRAGYISFSWSQKYLFAIRYYIPCEGAWDKSTSENS